MSVSMDGRFAILTGGASETAIHMRSGHAEFVFRDGDHKCGARPSPGDYIFVPPYPPHREENPDPARRPK